MNRAAALLARPGAWLEAAGEAYLVRVGQDRRRRPLLRLDEAAFAALAREPGLKPRGQGGYVLARPPEPDAPPAARPGVMEGERMVAEADGRLVARRANLGESPIAWLARRRDPQGRPWLTPLQAAAGERLRDDFMRAGTLGRLTMAWDAGPRSRGGRGPGLEPAERARAAKDRIARALDAVGPGLREILERVCGAGSALDATERALGLPRRSGKTVLALALDRLAGHYGL
ncbi:DUF6456 domain-containing protein [Caulobacter segnis]|uniref:DUF6456 domain-containing protein n=1 Tax=Caulobacter segnis TaxID=88688 RepID=UPI00240FE9A5|nr:DUF6456 domain-containing protein [Caulobacter segnis]MDG2523347.1 DUF6456 domain-containing protein [Caulobacter segnis]